MTLHPREANKKIVVAFDVDGTLITFDDIPRYDIIKMAHDYIAMGCVVIIHSGGGQDYAQQWSEKLGLTQHNVKAFAKGSTDSYNIDISYDDEIVTFGKVNIHV